jgi:UDP-N-acetyl-D-mannosaminuronic acid dehydrogenase
MGTGAFEFDVCVVGGCGHVGLPLAIMFASRGLRVAIDDIDENAVAVVNSGRMPFIEPGAEDLLRTVIGRTLTVANDPTLVGRARFVVVVIGTPVDAHLNPTFHMMRRFLSSIVPHLVDGQCLILRSTVYPGTTSRVRELIAASTKNVHVAFCPERVAEGRAMIELAELPQIVSGYDPEAVELSRELFSKITNSILVLEPREAELTKIFANVWRYIQFATANQFFMIATDLGLDFFKIHHALTKDYPRMAGLPKSGFAAGPCLLKDTMQLAAATNNAFALGHAAMLVNEGLPNFIVRHAKDRFPLHRMNVGILGMAFKAESDDPRESLSYKLRKVLEYEAATVLATDPYVTDPSLTPLEDVLERADLLILAVPHKSYASITLPAGRPVVDVWNFFGKGVFIP